VISSQTVLPPYEKILPTAIRLPCLISVSSGNGRLQ
jgi:hypothetical protein